MKSAEIKSKQKLHFFQTCLYLAALIRTCGIFATTLRTIQIKPDMVVPAKTVARKNEMDHLKLKIDFSTCYRMCRGFYHE